jgi:hypothetical protein
MSTTPAQVNALRELVRARLAVEQATTDLRVALQPLPADSRKTRAAIHAAEVLECQYDDWRDIGTDELRAVLDSIHAKGD